MESQDITRAQGVVAVVTSEWLSGQELPVKPKPLPANLFLSETSSLALDDREAARRLWLRQKVQHA